MPSTRLTSSELALPQPRQIDSIAGRSQGVFVVVALTSITVALLWASVTHIDRVSHGPGRIMPQTQNQQVQHLEGGIVTDIYVREGDKVKAGDPIMRVENGFFRSDLNQSRIETDTKRLRITRLNAEIEDERAPAFTEAQIAQWPDVVQQERSIFDTRRANLIEQLAILTQQQRQKEIELSELRSRKPLVEREREIIEERMTSLRRLSTAGAVSINDVLEMERMLQQTLVRQSDLAHDIPKTEASLNEISSRKKEIQLRFRADAEKERAQAQLEIDKLVAAQAALSDRMKRSEVIAPMSGTINKLNVSTVGGVVKAGEPIAQIVPIDTSVIVEMKLAPSDRANVYPGQRAVVKVSAYESTTFGTLAAKVVDVSPDALQDERGEPYFRVRLEASSSSFAPDKPVVPGMMADVDVISGNQSVLDNILRPLRRVREEAFRR